MIDFKPDGINDVILLTSERYWVEAFGEFFYYGYKFDFGIDSETKTNFIEYVKFSPSIEPIAFHPEGNKRFDLNYK